MMDMNSIKLVTQKIPIIFDIDVDPDPFLVNRHNPEPWLGFEEGPCDCSL